MDRVKTNEIGRAHLWFQFLEDKRIVNSNHSQPRQLSKILISKFKAGWFCRQVLSEYLACAATGFKLQYWTRESTQIML